MDPRLGILLIGWIVACGGSTAVAQSPGADWNHGGMPVISLQDQDPLKATRPQIESAGPAEEVDESVSQSDPVIPVEPDFTAGDFARIEAKDSGIVVGSDFFGLNDNFDEGLLIRNSDIAMKIGGYVKADLIQDFNLVGNEDAFDVTTIATGIPAQENTRFHARQTRFNVDVRYRGDGEPIRMFVEGDFFFNQRETAELGTDRFRLRHAYGQVRNWTLGQTWTTFSDPATSPATLDFEGQVASVNIRRALVRWDQPIRGTDWSMALSIEDPFTENEIPSSEGQVITDTPDLVARLKWVRPHTRFQVAGLVRQLAFLPNNQPLLTDDSWGLNFTNVTRLGPSSKFYWEVIYGHGIGSFRGIPDVALVNGPEQARVMDLFGYMVGATHEWNDRLSSNLTYAESRFTNAVGLPGDQLNNSVYLAANLIYSPYERVDVGVEYLYGKRENVDGQSGLANRLQFSFIFYLP